MKQIGYISDIGIDYLKDEAKITVSIPNKTVLEEAERLKDFEELDIEIKRHRKKRSKNANDYFWKLLSEYCEEKEVDTIQEYKDRVKRLGIFRRFRIEPKDTNTFEIMWTNRGIAWFCEIADIEYIGEVEFKIINAYYGSSSYNSKQMSRLINDLVEDCKEVGIETKSSEEIQSLIESWCVK